MGIARWEWEGTGIKNPFPNTSNAVWQRYQEDWVSFLITDDYTSLYSLRQSVESGPITRTDGDDN